MEKFIKYKILGKAEKIRIFGDEFVKNNIENLKIIYENEELELNAFFDLSNNKKKKNFLEIQLKIIKDITNLSYMFSGCKELLSVPFITKINVDKVLDMSFLFSNCSSLSLIPDISNWNTSNVSNMASMFGGCILLSRLPDISKWNTSNVKNMSKLFFGCSSLITLPDLSKWNTSNVTNMNNMFQGCRSLSDLPDISNWDVSNVININSMFYGCQSLSSIPNIAKWNTSKIIDMSFMFYNCSKINSLPGISKWDINSLKKYTYMFVGCSSLNNYPDFAKIKNESNNNISNASSNKENKSNKGKINKKSENKSNNKIEACNYNYYLCCQKCGNIPDVLFQDKNNILLTCIKCGFGENEDIETIINGMSKWTKKLIYYCDKHEKEIPASKYCESCKLLLCESCLKSHEKIGNEHKILELSDLSFVFCFNHHKQKLNYYCYNCKYEICEECKISHKSHVCLENKKGNEVLNSEIITNMLEIVQNDTYQIVNNAFEVMVRYQPIEHMSEFDKTKNYIFELFHNDKKIKHNLIYLSKILFFSSHRIKNYRKEIIPKYKTILKIINGIVSQENENFEKLINQQKENFIVRSKRLLKNEEQQLDENIKNMFKPMEKDINDFDKKKKFIEDNINYTDILKRYIIDDKIQNPDNYIDIDETINNADYLNTNLNSKENGYFILSLLGKCIENNGIQSFISKSKNTKFKDIEMASIQSLIGLGNEKKFEIHFDFGHKENDIILNNEEKKEEFTIKYKKEISDKLKIDINNLIFTNIHHGSVSVDVSIMNGAKKEEEELLSLSGSNNIKTIEVKPLLGALQISPDILDPKGDRHDGWGINEKRGGEDYIPPLNGWYGIGLKVRDKYDNGDNSWLDYANVKGEFAIAYLGINNFLNEQSRIVGDLNNLSRDIQNFMNDRLYKDEDNIRSGLFNKLFTSKCGDGICLFQNPEYAENSTGNIDVLGERIKIILMCRVNPKKIRQPKRFPQCWILNPTPDEVRPYRILIKKIPISPLSGASNDTIITATSPIEYIISSIKSNDLSFYKLSESRKLKKYTEVNKQKINKEFFAIRLYSSQNYIFINHYLRTKTILKKEKKSDDLVEFSESQLKSWICCLQLALKNNKNVKNNTIVYRGIKNFKLSPEIGIGSKFYFREFISTSLNKSVAEKFKENKKGTFLTITIKNNGVDGHPNYCYYIKGISYFPQEEEILISSHCYYTVNNIAHKNDVDFVDLTCEGYLLDK